MKTPVHLTCAYLAPTVPTRFSLPPLAADADRQRSLRQLRPVVFNREELQYGTYEVSVWGCLSGDEGGEILEDDEVLE